MSTNTGLNTLGFIQANSLTYTEIMRDYDAFIGALSEDEKLGFKTLFEGTNSQILTEMISAKESDELYHIITSRSENLMYYLNRWDSATAISQNYSYSTYRGSNIKLQITLTPDQTIVLPKFSTVATSGDMDLIITKDVELTQGVSTTFVAYVGTVKEQELVADTEDLLVFRFTNSNISEQITDKGESIMAELKYEIVETLGSLGENSRGWNKEVNLISWNDREPKYDIRDWAPDHSRMGKGVTLSADEMAALKDLLAEIDFDSFD